MYTYDTWGGTRRGGGADDPQRAAAVDRAVARILARKRGIEARPENQLSETPNSRRKGPRRSEGTSPTDATHPTSFLEAR